ncbi:MAG: hypothetical protein KDI64_20905 [Candidatus Accumulibacter sp.]|nr:hypothetical protein [Accumulibacter sp.]
MSNWLVVLSCGLAVGVVFWWMASRRSVAPAEPESSRKRSLHPYRCVAIKRCAKSCAAAADIEGRRFLTDEAPLLPLANCDTGACRCSYTRFDDRRDDERRHPHALGRGFADAGGTERRRAIDRRSPAEFA